MKLLLSPHKLGKDLLLIEAVELTKKAGIPQLETTEPLPSLLREQFPQLPKEARDAVCFFTKSALISAKAEIDRNGKLTGTDPDYRKQMGQNSLEFIRANTGASALISDYLKGLIH